MNIEERLKILMDRKGFLRKCDFARYLDITTQNLNQWFVRGVPNTEILKEKYPEISMEWLVNGNGPMILPDYSMFDENGIPYTESKKDAPLLPTELITENNISVDSFKEEYKDRIRSYEPSQLMPPFDLIYRVHQSNMSPSIDKGDIVFLKKLRSIDDVIDGEPYFIDVKNNSKMVYNLSSTSDMTGFICESVAPDYPTIRIYKENIYSIYSIVAILSYDVRKNSEIKSLLSIIEEKDRLIKSLNSQISQLISQSSSQSTMSENLVGIMKEMQSSKNA